LFELLLLPLLFLLMLVMLLWLSLSAFGALTEKLVMVNHSPNVFYLF